MEQLYVIRIDRKKQYAADRDAAQARIAGNPRYTDQAQAQVDANQKVIDLIDAGTMDRYSLHTGGRGNGAVGGLYTKKQLARIIGRYPEGHASACPVALGFTQESAEEADKEALMYNCLLDLGVDNWDGWDDACDEFRAQRGDDDE